MLGPSLIFGEPSQAEVFDKVNQSELFSEKASRAKLSQTKLSVFQNWAIFYNFQLTFLKEFNFLVEKTYFYWCLQDYNLKNWQKCWRSAHFLLFGNLIFWIIEQAELNRAFFARYGVPRRAFWKALRAEPNQGKPSFGLDPTLFFSHFSPLSLFFIMIFLWLKKATEYTSDSHFRRVASSHLYSNRYWIDQNPIYLFHLLWKGCTDV